MKQLLRVVACVLFMTTTANAETDEERAAEALAKWLCGVEVERMYVDDGVFVFELVDRTCFERTKATLLERYRLMTTKPTS